MKDCAARWKTASGSDLSSAMARLEMSVRFPSTRLTSLATPLSIRFFGIEPIGPPHDEAVNVGSLIQKVLRKI